MGRFEGLTTCAGPDRAADREIWLGRLRCWAGLNKAGEPGRAQGSGSFLKVPPGSASAAKSFRLSSPSPPRLGLGKIQETGQVSARFPAQHVRRFSFFFRAVTRANGEHKTRRRYSCGVTARVADVIGHKSSQVPDWGQHVVTRLAIVLCGRDAARLLSNLCSNAVRPLQRRQAGPEHRLLNSAFFFAPITIQQGSSK